MKPGELTPSCSRGLLTHFKVSHRCLATHSPCQRQTKTVFWEEKGMPFPQHASPAVTNHSSSYNPEPWRKIGQGLCCHWWMFYNRMSCISQLMFIFRGTTSFLWSVPEGCSLNHNSIDRSMFKCLQSSRRYTFIQRLPCQQASCHPVNQKS